MQKELTIKDDHTGELCQCKIEADLKKEDKTELKVILQNKGNDGKGYSLTTVYPVV